MSPHSTKLIGTEIVQTALGFGSLEEEWEDLYRNCALATPFQSWAWLYSWWESYGDDRELRLIAARNGEGLLVGIIPLMLERRWGFGKLLFVGTGQTDYLDVLVREGWEEEVFEAGVRALERLGSWQVADLQDLRPDAAAWGIFRRWNGPRSSGRLSSSVVIDVRPWDELLQSVDRKLRNNARRHIRRVEADGVRCQLAEPADAERAARTLVALSRERWQERWRETGPGHWTPRFETHTVTAARRMTASGLGGISEFWRDGEVVISHFLVYGRDFVGQYLIGASQEALKRYQFSSLGIWDGVNLALSRDNSTFDLLRGEEPYKLQWGYKTPLYRFVLGRNRLPWIVYTGYRALRSRAREHLDSEAAPQWVRDAYARYHRNLRPNTVWSLLSESARKKVKELLPTSDRRG